jgi:hypothetical protein
MGNSSKNDGLSVTVFSIGWAVCGVVGLLF